ncbi:MAG: NADH-quinone oxidoreductase subunit L [Armatimonadota bacterium]
MLTHAYLIPFFPLLAFAILIAWGWRMRGNAPAYVAIGGMVIACLWSWCVAAQVLLRGAGPIDHSATWLVVGQHALQMGFKLDPLSAIMLFMVPFVCTVIEVYSIGYMHGDPRFSRFFAYMSLFCFSMLLLVLSNNLLQIYICWELVGVCSYFLIGFWYERHSAALAAKKAFITTRLGDFGMFLGIMFAFFYAPTLNFGDLFAWAATNVEAMGFIVGLIAFLLFFGAIGKSAQFPLHTWLPDAMEGPTPVSALIHAATMVAAGVFLVARLFPLFWITHDIPIWSWGFLGIEFTPLLFVATIGTITLLLAALIAVVQSDIKRVLAYSTISQLGYMMLGLGAGVAGFTAGIFHLITHAFFKAGLFLGSGSVIHATDTNDMWRMGGLARRMPHTHLTFLIVTLALVGIPPFAGFWSKDEILAAVFSHGRGWMFVAAEVGAFLTAFYMTRLMYLTFYGEPRDPGIEPHESPRVMTWPLWVLAVGSVVVGLTGTPWANLFHGWVQYPGTFPDQAYLHIAGMELPEVHHGANWSVMALSVGMALAGIALGRSLYNRPGLAQDPLQAKLAPIWRVLENKFYFDHLYDIVLVKGLIINPWTGLAHLARRLDDWVIDRIVDGAAHLSVAASALGRWLDDHIVDKIVDGFGWVSRGLGAIVNGFQTGRVQDYLVWGLAAAGIIAAVMALF